MRLIALLSVTVFVALPPLQAMAQDLADVYHLALQNDAKLAAAATTRKAKLEAKPQARSLLLPQLNGSASIEHYHDHVITPSKMVRKSGRSIPRNQRYWEPSAAINLTQPIFDWNAWSQLAQADSQIAVAEAQFQAAKQELLIRAANAYFNLLQSKDNLHFVLAEKKAIAHQLNQAKQRFQVGTAANTDLQNAKARFDQAKSQAIQAKAKVRDARHALRVITGVQPTGIQPLRKKIPLSTPDPGSPEAWVNIAMTGNLQIKQAKFQSQIAKKQIQIARSGHYPTLDLVAGYSYMDGSDSFTGQEATEAAYGLQLNIPIFSGGGIHAEVKQAQYQYQTSLHQLDEQRRQARANTLDDYDNVVLGVSRVKALIQNVHSAKVSLQATKDGHRVGTRTEVDVLDAVQAYYQAKETYSQARYTYLENLLQLKRDAGSLGPSDIMAVDQLVSSDDGTKQPQSTKTSKTASKAG
jgi:outer membrane protein